MAKKKPMGFETPSMRIQDEYEGILKQLRRKKANWGKILTGCDEIHEYVSNGVENLIQDAESQKRQAHPMELEHRVQAEFLSLILFLVSRVGMELSECDERISGIEKELKDLRKGI
jgi:hypothetical protein